MPTKVKETVETPPKLKRQKAVAPKKIETPKKAPAKKPSPLANWQSHLKSYRESNPEVSLKVAMQEAKKTYHK